MRDVIPEGLFRRIQAHLRERMAHAEHGWEPGADEEDTLTGDLGGSLRTLGWIESPRDAEPWHWRITYKKFRGRGDGAPEKQTGADGIFQVEVHRGNEALIVPKGILFQAKKFSGSSRSDLIDQVTRMEQTAPGGSAVFEFSPDGYRGASGRDVLLARERHPDRIPHPDDSLGHYLADRFLGCESGLRGMYYDAVRGILVVPLEQGGVKVVRVSLGHRIALEVRHNGRRTTEVEGADR